MNRDCVVCACASVAYEVGFVSVGSSHLISLVVVYAHVCVSSGHSCLRQHCS